MQIQKYTGQIQKHTGYACTVLAALLVVTMAVFVIYLIADKFFDL